MIVLGDDAHCPPPLDDGGGLPNVERAAKYKAHCDTKIVQSLAYLIDVAERGLGQNFSFVHEKLRTAKNSLDYNPTPNLSSLIYAAHNLLRDAFNAQDPSMVTEVIDGLGEITWFSRKLRVGPLDGSPWTTQENQWIRETLDRSSNTTYGKAMDLIVPSGGAIESGRSSVETALGVLREIDPTLFGEVMHYLTDIVYFSSEVDNSGSSFRCLGLIVVNCLREGQNWTTALEMIVHEAAHQHVYAVMTTETLIRNEEDRLFPSALRADPRPLSGIFHGMYVMARTIYIMSKLQKSGILQESRTKIVTPRNNACNTDPYYSKFMQLYSVIDGHADLSELGRKMTDSCYEIAQNGYADPEMFAESESTN